jgi:hypothetical protein
VIILGAVAAGVVLEDGLPEARRLGEPYVPADALLEELRGFADSPLLAELGDVLSDIR